MVSKGLLKPENEKNVLEDSEGDLKVFLIY